MEIAFSKGTCEKLLHFRIERINLPQKILSRVCMCFHPFAGNLEMCVSSKRVRLMLSSVLTRAKKPVYYIQPFL